MRNHKKFLGLGLVILFIFAIIGLGAGAASATGNHDNPEVNGKPVTVCHATGSRTNPYVKLTNVPLVQFLGNNGHAGHGGDIWAPFSYVQRDSSSTWHTVNVAGQGDQSLLAFDNCTQPKVDTPVTIPEAVYNDECGTENDIFSVAPGEGYTVGAVQMEGNNQVITVTLNDGFKWSTGGDNYTPQRYIKPAFTDVACDLPDTGAAQTAQTAGYAALGGVLALGLLMTVSFTRRQRSRN